MEILLITICLAIFFLICLFRLDLGLFVLSVLLPTYLVRFKVGFLPSTFLEGMILVIIIAFLIKTLAHRKFRRVINEYKRVLKPWLIPVILFLLAATISVFVSCNLRSAVGIWKAYFIEPILLFLVFISAIKTKRQIRLILYGLGISAIWVSVIAIYQKFTGWAIPDPIWQASPTRRVTSIYGYPNALGLYLGPIIVLYFGLALGQLRAFFWTRNYSSTNTKSNGPLRYIFYILVIVLSSLAVVFARSHGAWLGVVAGIFFLGLLSKKRAWFILAIVILILLFSFPQTRMKILDWAGYEENIRLRLDLWRDSLRLIKYSPLLGTGLAGFQTIYEKYRQVKHFGLFPYPHNIVLNFWLETGLLGLIAFVWLVVRFFKSGFAILRKELSTINYQLSAGLMAAMVCLIIHGLVDVPYFKNDLSVQFWIFVGLLVVANLGLDKKKKID